MRAPLYSTIALFTELLLTGAVGYTLYSGYKKNIFPKIIAFSALLYETVFNISYMALQTPKHVNKEELVEPWKIVLAASHGILSLIMFISLCVFFIVAYFKYKSGENYFEKKKKLMWIFLVFWLISVLSGVLFYVVEYVI